MKFAIVSLRVNPSLHRRRTRHKIAKAQLKRSFAKYWRYPVPIPLLQSAEADWGATEVAKLEEYGYICTI